jgi:hypothetical protein
MSLKNAVTPPGIDPGTVRLVAQLLNHYATPNPTYHMYLSIKQIFFDHLKNWEQEEGSHIIVFKVKNIFFEEQVDS